MTKRLVCFYSGVANVVACGGKVAKGPAGCDAYCAAHNAAARKRAANGGDPMAGVLPARVLA